MPNQPSALAGTPVAAIEHRLKWRVMSLIVFILILGGLGVVAILSAITPPRIVVGLPDDPDLRAAQQIVYRRISFAAGGLRFGSTLLGDNPGARFTETDETLVGRAEERVESARRRHAGDPRVRAATASLDLARGRLESAERGYRWAIDRSPHYGEARLGLGVTLALRGQAERDASRVRGFLLKAIGQLAAVPERDPHHLEAVYDRALLLSRVGRSAEARRNATTYLASDSTSRWAKILARTTGLER